MDTVAQSSIISATQTAYSALRQMIVTGELRPGEKLKIENLKERLETGASPIREALSLLVSDQLVERLDQRGFRAAPVSHQNFSEILMLRCALEDMALRQSIAHADDAWEETIVLAHHRMARVDPADIPVFEDLHKTFHMAMLANCASPILLRYCSQLYDLNVRYRYLAGRSQNYGSRDVPGEHREILEAAAARNADLASSRLLSHYQQTGEFLRQLSEVPGS
ncbi:GntR family transcriptional regulator [uncultured Roseibium sp.]|uniref:GntR family transcriptional regulator n=1 Tax=uncultured Roseibium sp. TaxID=1936171 RepID=UPI00262A4F4C|nr:GntR family transcriptional regulator [uncultured Roseibium sp.]